MSHTRRMIIRGLWACALVFLAAALSHAATTPILTLNLSNVAAGRIGMNAGGILSTLSDGDLATTGDQNTDVSYVGPLDGLFADISTPAASFTMSNLSVSGPPTVFGSLVFQNYVNGNFELYGPSPGNELLLSGSLSTSTLLGVTGGPGADPSYGTIFTSSLDTVTGGTLQTYILGGSVALQMHISNAVTPGAGAGFHVDGGVLSSFSANSAVTISGSAVPEPATLLLMGAAASMAGGRWRRRQPLI